MAAGRDEPAKAIGSATDANASARESTKIQTKRPLRNANAIDAVCNRHETVSSSQRRLRRASRKQLIAETIVLAVRIIMSPTCSKRDLAGRNALSARDLTIALLRSHPPCWGAAPHVARATHRKIMGWEGRSPPTTVAPARDMNRPELLRRSSKGGGRVRGMLPAPLEESV